MNVKQRIRLAPHELQQRFAAITVLVLDCDGVMTGNELVYDRNGDDQHVFFARDSNGLMMLRAHAKVRLGVLSGRGSESVSKRFSELRFEHIVQRAYHKGTALKALATEHGYPMSEICYIGDDINDIGAIHLAGLGIAVNDAVPELRERADYITAHRGGRGAVREVCDAILKAKGLYDGIIAAFDAEA